MELNGVYTQLGILFCLMSIGYVLGKTKFFTQQSNAILSSFIVKVALPAVIISSMCMPLTKEVLQRALAMLGLSLLVYTMILIVAWMLPRFMTKNEKQQGILSFSIMFSNCAFMGFPVLGALLGDEAIFYVAIYNIIFNILVYTLGIKFLERGKNQKNTFDIKLLINPGIIASLIGLIIFFGKITLPSVILGAIDSVASICTPLSMLVIGAMLSGMSIKEMFGERKIYILSLIRLIFLPFMIFILTKYILKLQDDWLIIIPVVVAGMPVASNAAMMASAYESDAKFASQVVMITTLISCISIPILIYFL